MADTENTPDVLWAVGYSTITATTDRGTADHWRNTGSTVTEYRRAPVSAQGVAIDETLATIAGVLAILRPLANGITQTASENLLAKTKVRKANIRDVMGKLSFAIPMLSKVYQAIEGLPPHPVPASVSAPSGAVDSEASRAAYKAWWSAATEVGSEDAWQAALAWRADQCRAGSCTRWTQAEIDQLRVNAKKLKARFNPLPQEIDDTGGEDAGMRVDLDLARAQRDEMQALAQDQRRARIAAEKRIAELERDNAMLKRPGAARAATNEEK